MVKQLGVLVVGLVLVPAGHLAHAAMPRPPLPNDSSAWWSWDARKVAFERELHGRHTTYTVPAGHGREQKLVAGTPRGWRPGGGVLLIDSPDVTRIVDVNGTRAGFVDGHAASWSPDGGSIAYLRDDTLLVASATGAGEHAVARDVVRPSWDVTGPVWSPDGRRIALATNRGLVLAQADGTGETVVFAGANQSVNPSWSSDGATIAFERNDGPHWVLWLLGSGGGDAHPITPPGSNARLPQWDPVGNRLAFVSDRQHLPGGATQYQFALYTERLGDARPTKLLDDVYPLSPPRWSPTAAQIAVAAGQKCGRFGIYIVASEGRRSRRASNLCRPARRQYQQDRAPTVTSASLAAS